MRFYIATAAAILSLAAGTAHAVDVTACDQTVPKGETGILVVDLVCPSGPGFCPAAPAAPCDVATPCPTGPCLFPHGVTLENRATLLLDGHSITGGFFSINTDGKRHTIVGPGHVEGSVVFKNRLRISDVTVSGGQVGVYSGILGRLDATNVTVTGTTAIGIRGGVIRGSNLVSNGNGSAGFECNKLRADNVTANDNGEEGIRCGKIKSTGITTNDNGAAGVQSGRTSRLTDFTSTGNGGPGYFGYFSGGRLVNATVEDIVSRRRPRLLGTSTCSGQSARFDQSSGPFGTWGVCDGD